MKIVEKRVEGEKVTLINCMHKGTLFSLHPENKTYVDDDDLLRYAENESVDIINHIDNPPEFTSEEIEEAKNHAERARLRELVIDELIEEMGLDRKPDLDEVKKRINERL